MPVVLKLGDLLLNGSGVYVSRKNHICGGIVALTQYIYKLLGFAGSKGDVRLKRTAGVGVVV